MSFAPRRTARGRGFTLIELCVTMLLLGVLVAVAVPRYTKSVETVKAQAAVAMLTQIGMANRMFATSHDGKYANSIYGTLMAECGDGACPVSQPPGMYPSCALVWCKYIPDQDWASLPYIYLVTAPPAANLAVAARRPGASPGTNTVPYKNWRYTMSRQDNTITSVGGAPSP